MAECKNGRVGIGNQVQGSAGANAAGKSPSAPVLARSGGMCRDAGKSRDEARRRGGETTARRGVWRRSELVWETGMKTPLKAGLGGA